MRAVASRNSTHTRHPHRTLSHPTRNFLKNAGGASKIINAYQNPSHCVRCTMISMNHCQNLGTKTTFREVTGGKLSVTIIHQPSAPIPLVSGFLHSRAIGGSTASGVTIAKLRESIRFMFPPDMVTISERTNAGIALKRLLRSQTCISE